MDGSDHTSRTLLLSKKAPGLMVINRGSNSNIDPEASSITTGHSQVKAFNLTNATDGPYDFNTDGLLLGWGLRNDVGMDEEPLHGGIYSVENSADQISRDGVDIHRDNPAEELNFLGYLNGTSSANQGRNFGYPECFTAWNTSAIPRFAGTVGQQFAIGESDPWGRCASI
jgi:glucose/arabinose dehydrogenase